MIKFKNIYFDFDGKDVVSDLSQEFPSNKINCLLGPSGCGKTTLLNLIGGLKKVKKGSIEQSTDSFSYVFQNDTLIPWLNAQENMALVLKPFFSGEELKRRIHESLSSVQMDNSLTLFPREMSGGMKQRLSLARAFSYPSDILLMDEPFTGLDISLKKNIWNLFLDLWNENNKTVILVTHDIDEAIHLSENIYVVDSSPIKTLHRFHLDKDLSLDQKREIKGEILDILNTKKGSTD